VVSSPQPRDRLRERGSKDDKVFTYMQKRKVGRKEKRNKESRKRRGQRNTKKISTQKVLEVEKSLWEKEIKENASTKGLGSRNKAKGEICTKKKEDLLFVEREKRRDASICGGSVKKGIYSTL